MPATPATRTLGADPELRAPSRTRASSRYQLRCLFAVSSRCASAAQNCKRVKQSSHIHHELCPEEFAREHTMSGKIEFAFWSPQAGATVKTLLDRAELAERLGYHSLWLVDHFWAPGMPDVDVLEAIPLMSAIAARTERLRIGTLVLCNSF